MNEAFVPQISPRSLHYIYLNEQYVHDVSLEFLYKPKTLTALFFCVFTIIFVAFSTKNEENSTRNTSFGIYAVIFCFLVFSMIGLPNGPFIRPHPVVWRLVLGISICYWLFMVFLLFQSPMDARKILFSGNAVVGIKEPVLKEYAANCDLTFVNIWNVVNDRFFFAHLFGWIIRALMIRNVFILWIASILWELVELSFLHMLPNFAECWWDSLVMDILLCNGVGIFIGLKIARYLEMKEYHWIGFYDIKDPLEKVRRAILQFSPVSWPVVDWKATYNWKRFVGVVFIISFLQLVDLNHFFLKHVLWIDTSANLNLYRLLFFSFAGAPALSQYYCYVTDSRCVRFGTHAWVILAIIITEFFVYLKIGMGIFTQLKPPNFVIWGWSMGLATILIMGLFIYIRDNTKNLEIFKSNKTTTACKTIF